MNQNGENGGNPLGRVGNRKMRVLQVGKFYPPYMGGIETHLHTLAGELNDVVELEVLVANDGRRTEEERIDGVRVTRVGTAVNLSAAPLCPEMVSRIRRSGADIVHIHLPNPGAVLAFLASGHRGPVVASHHSDIVRQRVLGLAFQPVMRHFLRRAAAVIAATPRHIENSTLLGDFRDRCRVIPYGIDVPPPSDPQPEETARVRERYGPRIILAVGRLVYYKGFEFLIRAMRDVDARLLIVGTGPLRARLEEEARSLGVADRVVFLGKVSDTRPYYRAADAFVLASTAVSEAFGIVQLEAMVAGTPVVNTAVNSGVPFVSLDGVSGFTVPPGDASALAGAINRLLGDPALRDRLGRAGRRRVEEEFSKEVMTRRILELYHQVLRAPVRAPAHAAGVPVEPVRRGAWGLDSPLK